MTEQQFLDMSHPTSYWTVQGLYPGVVAGEDPTWHAVLFLRSQGEARSSLEWVMDSPSYDKLLDARVAAPTLRPRASGCPWAPLSPAERRAFREASEALEARNAPVREHRRRVRRRAARFRLATS